MNKTAIPFEEFEKAVIRKILEKKSDVNEILWEQYMASQVIKRNFTGVGFFTDFKIPKDVPHATELIDRSYEDVVASING